MNHNITVNSDLPYGSAITCVPQSGSYEALIHDILINDVAIITR